MDAVQTSYNGSSQQPLAVPHTLHTYCNKGEQGQLLARRIATLLQIHCIVLPSEQTEELTCRCKPAQAASTAQPKFVVVVSPLLLDAAGVVLGVDSKLGLLTGELLTGDVTGLLVVVTVVAGVVLLS